ncbi:MAG: carotenoid biosynthesis protein [Salinispira sp.]
MKFSIALLVILIILYTVGVFGHLHQPTYDLMLALTPLFLILAAVFVILQILFSHLRTVHEKRYIMFWFILCYFIAWFLEYAGVETGAVFGEYSYGTTLGPKLLGVPLVIGLNWCIIVFAAIETLRVLRLSLFLRLLITPLWIVLFDLVLEPFAMGKANYWTWANNQVPLQNYLMWGSVAFVFSIFYIWMVPESDSVSRKNTSDHNALRSGVPVFFDKYFPGLVGILQFVFIFLLRFFLN